MIDPQDAEAQAMRRRLQSELFVFEGDKSRFTRLHEDATIAIRKLKTDIGHLQGDLEVKVAESHELERKIATLTDEIARHKRKMNTL
jgi:uncharacterized small protein (DUF1192 family)